MTKTLIVKLLVDDSYDNATVMESLPGLVTGVRAAQLLQSCAHWDRPYRVSVQTVVAGDPPTGDHPPRQVLFTDVTGAQPPSCGWCKLPVRVGELLVWAQLGSRAEGYVHEFCVGKIAGAA
jgi:hypothetical protein